MIIIGIDPGITGAVAIITEKEGKNTVEIIDTPSCKIKKGKNKKDYLPQQMADIFSVYTGTLYSNEKIHLFIEQVHSMPGQGVSSTFNFGKGYGIWLGIIAAFNAFSDSHVTMTCNMVTPQKWKKEMMFGMSKEKEAALIRASQLFPQMSSSLARKKDVDRADALLIAAYGLRQISQMEITNKRKK